MVPLTDVNEKMAKRAYAAARARLLDCQAQINAYADAHENYPNDNDRDEYLQDVGTRLEELVQRALVSTTVALEMTGLTQSLRLFLDEITKLAPADYHKVEYFDEYYGANNPVVNRLNHALDAIAPMFEIWGESTVQYNVLMRMLRQSAHYIETVGNQTDREKDVQDALEPPLRLAFPDVIRGPSTAQQTKVYHPDFGIESISTAIEVKFVAGKDKAAIAIGAIYEDMKGYAGSSFKEFVALIFMTGAWLTEEMLAAEWNKVGSPKNWRAIIVVGRGRVASPASAKKVKSAPAKKTGPEPKSGT